MNDKAIVTLTIGENFSQNWKNYCYKNWKSYADKYNYDLITIDEPLDVSERARKRSASWQKCLILSHPKIVNYRQVVWIDADILINTEIAPCICSMVPENRIGGVKADSYPTKEISYRSLKAQYELWSKKNINYIDNLTPYLFYKNYGIETDISEIFQMGVFVASPKYHCDIFKKAYDEYEDKGASAWNYEMRPLSYEIIRSGLVEWIPFEFNFTISPYLNTHYPFLLNSPKNTNRYIRKFSKLLKLEDFPYEKQCIQTVFRNSYFCHFAGMGFSKMKYILPTLND
ncbi:hypothetical protein JYQ62_21485 [Nostoc sp. UHCC 0702]|nr:hypothetical protein JYQ62_21485 [Nostoc sp. UHCC 0702]